MNYYICDNRDRFGPFSKIELLRKGISKDTLVWFEGLSEWKKAAEIEDLADLFAQEQTPPPLPNQKTTYSSLLIQDKTIVLKTQQQKKSKKKTIIWICGFLLVVVVFVVIGVVGYNLYEQYNFEQTLDREKSQPSSYLSLDNLHVEGHRLKGTIYNFSSYTAYKHIKIAVVYFGQNSEILQEDTYVVDGPCYSNSPLPFDIRIRYHKGLKRIIKTENCDIEIIGAESYN